MDTRRLRVIQHPERAMSLLESFVRSQDMVPRGSERVKSLNELTAPLRRLARQSESGEGIWCAWTQGVELWFFTATPSLDLSRERGKPVLHIASHDDRGAITATSPYVYTAQGWQSCA